MVCKKCNTECPDDSVFCFACGERVDGKKCCPVCKRPVTEGAVICECGARVDGKKVCVCGKEQDEGTKFCPQCGRVQVNQEQTKAWGPQVKEKQKDCCASTGDCAQKRGMIFSYITTGLAMFSLLMFFIAIFTPIFQINGVDISRYVGVDGGSANGLNNMFYDYFYKVFADYSRTAYSNAAGYIILAFSSLIVLANLVVSIVMFILGLVHGIKAYVKKQKVNLTKYVVTALIVNAVMALWFSASSASLFVRNNGVSMSAGQGVGGGSLLAYVFAAIAIITTVVFKIIERRKEFVSPKNLTRFILNCAAIIFVFILFGLVGSHVFKAYQSEYDYYYGYETIMSVGLGVISMLLNVASALKAGSTNDVNVGFDEAVIFSIASSVIFIAIVVISAILLKKLIARFTQIGLEKKEGGGCLALTVVVCVLSIIYLAFNILVTNSPNMEIFSLGAQSVTAVVAAFFALGVLIAAKVIEKTSKPKAPDAQQISL